MAKSNLASQEEYDYNDQENVGPVVRDSREKLLSGKATNFEKKPSANDEAYREEAANQAFYEEQLEAVAIAETKQAVARSLQNRQRVIQNQQRLAGIKAKVRGAAGMARWGGITIAGTAWFWQMLAGAVSLVAFGGRGAIDYFLKETLLGKIFNGTIGYFIDLHSFIPFDTLALAFWAIATLIGVLTFLGFLIFFYLTGAKPFESTVDYLIGALVFACCILPVGNLFPAVVVWVAYVNLSTIKPLITKRDVMGGV